MKCDTCNGTLDEVDDELVCQECGSTFGLEYLGMYEEGASERHDEGFEPKEWKEKYKK
jgi:hypothetical protein